MKLFKVPGKVRKQITLCCQALFMKISKVPGKVRKKITLCCQAKWKSAEVLHWTSMLPGQVQKCGSITLNFNKKCPGWTLLNSALEPTQVFHLQTMGEMTKLSTVAVHQLYDTMHMLCHIFGQMSRFARIVSHFSWNGRNLRALSHFSWNVAIYVFCQAQIFCCQAPKTILHPCPPPPRRP